MFSRGARSAPRYPSARARSRWATPSLCCVVTTLDKLVAFSVSTKAKVAEAKLAFSPTCVAVAPSDGLVAVGGEDNAVHVLNPDGSEKLKLDETQRQDLVCRDRAQVGPHRLGLCEQGDRGVGRAGRAHRW